MGATPMGGRGVPLKTEKEKKETVLRMRFSLMENLVGHQSGICSISRGPYGCHGAVMWLS